MRGHYDPHTHAFSVALPPGPKIPPGIDPHSITSTPQLRLVRQIKPGAPGVQR